MYTLALVGGGSNGGNGGGASNVTKQTSKDVRAGGAYVQETRKIILSLSKIRKVWAQGTRPLGHLLLVCDLYLPNRLSCSRRL